MPVQLTPPPEIEALALPIIKRHCPPLRAGKSHCITLQDGVANFEGFKTPQNMRHRKDGETRCQVYLFGGLQGARLYLVAGRLVSIVDVKAEAYFAPLPLETREDARAWMVQGFNGSLPPKGWADMMQWKGADARKIAADLRECVLRMASGLIPEPFRGRIASRVRFPSEDRRKVPETIAARLEERLEEQGKRIETLEAENVRLRAALYSLEV